MDEERLLSSNPAGLLAFGSSPISRLPIHRGQWLKRGGYPITVAPPQRILTAFPICARSSSTTRLGWPSRITLSAVANVVNAATDQFQVLEFRSVNEIRLSAAWFRRVVTSGSVMLPASSMKLATWGRRTRGWWRTCPPSDSML